MNKSCLKSIPNNLKVVFLLSRLEMWFGRPLPHGMPTFGESTAPEKRRKFYEKSGSRLDILRCVVLFSILGPSGWPQGLKRLPKGRPEGFQKGSQTSTKLISKPSQDCAVTQGTSGVTQGTPGHQNDIKMTWNDFEMRWVSSDCLRARWKHCTCSILLKLSQQLKMHR